MPSRAGGNDLAMGFRVYDQRVPYFITSSILYRIPVFSRDDYFQILVDSLNHCTANKGLRVHAYVIMPNHFHMVASSADSDLSGAMRDLKKHTSKELARKLGEDGRSMWLSAMRKAAAPTGKVKVWDEEFHPEEVHDEVFLNQKIDYLHNNPVKAGYVEDPCAWKYSSAGFYFLERESPVIITPLES